MDALSNTNNAYSGCFKIIAKHIKENSFIGRKNL